MQLFNGVIFKGLTDALNDSPFIQAWEGEGAIPPPPGTGLRITDSGSYRITDAGNYRITD